MSRSAHALPGSASPRVANIVAVRSALVAAVLMLLLSVAAPCRAQPEAAPFDLLEIEVEGNSVLGAPAIEAAVEPHLGPGKGMAGVEAARSSLEAAYQKAGYLTVLVDVPEQRIEGGVVRLVVIEGRVGGLYVTGSRYHDQGFIRSRVSELAEGSVPDFNRVQAQLAGVNRSEDRRVQPVLKPGRLPGTVDVELQVADSLPLSGTLEVNNQHAFGTDPLRSSASLRYENLFQLDHTLSLTLLTAPMKPEQSRVLVANYSIPEGEADNWTLSLALSDSDVETLGGTQVIGNGTTVGLRRAVAIGRRGVASGAITLGADLKLLKERTVFGAGEISTPLRYVPFQLGYNDQWSEGALRLQWNASLTAAMKALLQRDVDCPLASGGSAPQDQFSCRRQGGDGSFLVGRIDLRAHQRLDLGAGPGSVSARLGGQVAARPLVSPEQYSIGGAETVRGYFESAASGDHALLGSLEWRTFNLASSLGPAWREASPLLFVDAGRVWTLEPAAGQSPRQSLAGAGFGLRVAGGEAGAGSAEGAIDFAWPLRATANTALGDLRVHARLSARF
jgi:hemolysin activation/secretion protein